MLSQLATLALPLLTLQTGTQDWPHYMGPDGTNRVQLEGVDFQWGEAGPRVLWKTELGGGYGGVAVKDGQVYLLDRDPGEADILRVLTLESGEDVWEFAYEAEGRLSYPGSRSVPTITGDHVLSMGGFGHVSCFDRKSQELKWQRDLGEDFGGQLPRFGWANSPLVVGDLVVVSALGEEVGLVALDIASGEEVWRTEGFAGGSLSTPVVLNLLGVDQLLFATAFRERGSTGRGSGMQLSSFEPKTGKLLWQEKVRSTRSPIPRPIQIDAERFFVTGGYGGGSSMLKLKRVDGKYALEELFHIKRGSQLHSPVLHEGHLYMTANENENNRRNLQAEGGLMCLSLEGEELWRTGDDPFLGRGSWLLAGDHLLVQDGFNGSLLVCKATPAGFEPVASSNVFGIEDRKDHETWAPMALVNGLLLMRSKDELLCIDLKRAAE